ncbi:hypothetical protein BKA70DRAFT_1272676 [Coprinopsis sp. MPI-PUGE-AT-0042]|nr:hypothetical protein BKA70DRAFT_1272676 [Coprinopsis sp. MPI-PUGE-AT-0042]
MASVSPPKFGHRYTTRHECNREIVRAPCPACQRSNPKYQPRDAQRVEALGALECKLCDKVFKTSSSLRSHARAAPKTHIAQHEAKCCTPGCRPQDCIGTPLGSTDVGGLIPSMDNGPYATTVLNSSNSSANPALPKLYNKGHCNYGLEMHMKISPTHHWLHSKVCHVQNCDPVKCFRGLAGVSNAPLAISEETTGRQPATLIAAAGTTTPPVGRRVIAGSGSPVPKPASTVVAPHSPASNSRASSSGSCNAKPKRHRRRGLATQSHLTKTANPATNLAPHTKGSSGTGHTFVEAGPPDSLPTDPDVASDNRKGHRVKGVSSGLRSSIDSNNVNWRLPGLSLRPAIFSIWVNSNLFDSYVYSANFWSVLELHSKAQVLVSWIATIMT